jgi:transcriptional regulator with XRE-family HTH domain
MDNQQRTIDPAELPGVLRALRERAGISQSEAARRSSVSQVKISRIETKAAKATPEEAAALAQVYGAPPDLRDRSRARQPQRR